MMQEQHVAFIETIARLIAVIMKELQFKISMKFNAGMGTKNSS
jgi:hypothetical protein